MGLASISFTEIKAWCELMRVNLLPGEVEIIKRLDGCFIEHYHKSNKSKKHG